MNWPHSHEQEAKRSRGAPLSEGETLTDINAIFVRCYACDGDGGDCECGGTGFDWSDTLDVRETIRRITEPEAGG